MKELKFKGSKLLFVVISIYFVLFIIDNNNSFIALNKFFNTLIDLLPIFTLIIIFTALVNYFLKPKQIMKHFGEDSGKKGIFLTIIGGMLSHGPMYAWYGVLSDMKEQGLKEGLIATFMYARAIKLPLLPFMVDIFGIVFTISINIYIILFSILQSKIIDKINTNK